MLKTPKIPKNCRPLIFVGMTLTTLAVILTGCSSELTLVAPTPPEHFERLGPASGSATGHLISPAVGTAYYFIPAGLNSRVERAYANALQSVPGATGLIDVTYQESWFWWVLGTGRTVSVSGEAIKEVK